MEDVDEDKMAQVLQNTGQRDQKYFAQQEVKTSKAEVKIAQFKEKILTHKKN
jgi:hypothetical protein